MSSLTNKFLPLIVIFTLILSLAMPTVALAQDGGTDPAPAGSSEGGSTDSGGSSGGDSASAPAEQPAAPAEQPAAPAEQPAAPAEQPAVPAEQPAAPAEQPAAPAEQPAAPAEQPAAPASNDAPAPAEEPAAAQQPASETAPEQEKLAEVVEAIQQAEGILVNQQGEVVSLASQEAVQALVSGDPYIDRGGTRYYFMPTGGCGALSNCTASGTPVQDAVTFANAGEVVNIVAGNYNEDVTISKSVTLTGIANGGLFDAIINSFTLNADISGWSHVFGTNIFVNPGGKIQDGIDIVQAGGTVNVAPGNYEEEATNRSVNGSGPYQFGLYIGTDKNGITVRGVKADGTPVTNYNDASAYVITNATNSFGTSGIFVEGNNVTISGLKIGDNKIGNNKTIEIIGDNFSLKNSQILPWDGGSVYFNDWKFDSATNTSYVKGYNIEGNYFANGGSLDLTSGAGFSGPVSGRKIIGNLFDGKQTDGTEASWAQVSFNGSGTGVPWFVYGTGGAEITGNTFQNGTQYIRARGDYDNTQFDWESYWNDNTFDSGAVTLSDLASFGVREYSYTSGSYVMNHVRRIGGLIQGEVDNAQNGDSILSKGVFQEQVNITNKNITLQGGGNTTIQSPNTLLKLGNTDIKPVVYVTGGSDVVIDGVTVDGLNKGTANWKFVGVEYFNAGGTLQNSIVKNIMDTSFSGVQHGVAIYGYNKDGANRTLNLLNNQVYNFQKNGVALYGNGLTVNVDGNTVTGAGRTSVTAQNGIQLAYGATGVISNNVVKDVFYSPASYTASGILLYEAGSTELYGNQVSGAQSALVAQDTRINSHNNIFTGSGLGDDWGVSVYEYRLPGSVSNSAIYNDVITGFSEGIYVNDPTVNIKYNKLSHNTVGLAADVTESDMVDARDNWWGSNDAPTNISGYADTSTWLKLGGSASPQNILVNGLSNLSGSRMYSSGDATQTAISSLSWFNPAEVTITEETALGTLAAGNVFTAGGLVGTATFSGDYDSATINGLTLVNISSNPNPPASDPGVNDDGGAGAPGAGLPGAGGVTGGIIPVTGGAAPKGVVIPVTGSSAVKLECGTSTLVLSNGITVTISGLCGNFTATFTAIESSSLPKDVEGNLVAAVALSILEDGKPLETLPAGVTITYTFPIPEKLKDAKFSAMSWNAAADGGAGGWNDLPSLSSVDGVLTLPINNMGTFVITAN